MRFITEGGDWTITLADGSIVHLWADGYETTDDRHEFGILVDTEGRIPDSVRVTNRTPSDPNRVVISIASFPVAAVTGIDGG